MACGAQRGAQFRSKFTLFIGLLVLELLIVGLDVVITVNFFILFNCYYLNHRPP